MEENMVGRGVSTKPETEIGSKNRDDLIWLGFFRRDLVASRILSFLLSCSSLLACKAEGNSPLERPVHQLKVSPTPSQNQRDRRDQSSGSVPSLEASRQREESCRSRGWCE